MDCEVGVSELLARKERLMALLATTIRARK